MKITAKNRLAAHIIMLICIGILPLTAFANGGEGEFLYKSQIKIQGDHTYKAIQLDNSVYRNAKEGLADLRITNDKNEFVPYFVYNSTLESRWEEVSFFGRPTTSYTKNNDVYMDFSIEKKENQDVYGNYIILSTATDTFAKEISILGSFDSIAWDTIKSDLIYNVNGNTKLNIEFDSTVKYPYYRIVVPNNREKVTISSIRLVYSQDINLKKDFSGSFEPTYTVSTEEKTSIIKIPYEQLKNIKIRRIIIETDDMFKREFITPLSSDILYNLTFDNLSLENKAIYIGGNVYRGETDFDIRIHNQDDKPLTITNIIIEYDCERVVFKYTEKDSFTMQYGNELLTKPGYDMDSYADYILRDGVDLCIVEATAFFETDNNEPKGGISEKMILNIAIGVVSVVLIVVIIKSASKKVKKDIKSLSLNNIALAKSNKSTSKHK